MRNKNIFVTNVEIFEREQDHPSNLAEFLQVHQQIRDKQVHIQFQNAHVEHL